MDKLKVTDGRSTDKVRELLSRVYNLRSNQYEITEFGAECVITLVCPDRLMDSKLLISTDGGAYHGYLSCYPSVNEGKMHTYEEILDYLKEEGVVVNVNEAVVKECFDRFATGEIIESVLIAEGVEPISGKDAEITIQFNAADKRPKLTADGKVDYKNVDNITMVRKGDLLLTKKPASSGVRGINVKHEEVVPISGKDIFIMPGDGATVNEAGTAFTATVDGYVDFGNKKIAVYPVYIVKGNVDLSIGNVKFNGSVHVKGDVLSGFKIEADKHILVDGICQDCELFARGNVILRTGIKGTGAGFIKAGGMAIIGYGEKARIHAREGIEVKKYAFNCELFSGGKVESLSGDGIVAGGVVRAFSEVTVKQLGTQGNNKFSVIVGSKYYIEFELERIRREALRINETLAQIEKALARFDLAREKIIAHPKIKKMMEVKSSLNSLVDDLRNREDKLIVENMAKHPKVKVKNKVFEGATVMFYNVASVVREPMFNVVFYYDEKYKEVAWVSMKDINAVVN